MVIDVLVLEDSEERHKYFYKYCKDSKILESAKTCIDMIRESEKINELWLDHDLGGLTYVDSNLEECGMEVVRFLSLNDYSKNINKVFIHSMNGTANRVMFEDLKKHGYNAILYPFHILRANIDNYVCNREEIAN